MSGTMTDGEAQIVAVAEIRDNWYVICDRDGRALMIGTWLPPDWAKGAQVAKIEPDEARLVISDLKMRTIDVEAREYRSVRVGHNNRLLAVGPWKDVPEGLANIQIDMLMPDQARELLDELRVRSEGDQVVGKIDLIGK